MYKLLILIFSFIGVINGASFDCTKATTNVEKMICEETILSSLDSELSTVFQSFYYVTDEIKSDQKAWLKERNKCQDNSCVQSMYKNRIEELNSSLSNEKTYPQTYLDGMKKAQVLKMKLVNKKDVVHTKYDEKVSQAFKEDFFRYKNVTFKEPILSEIKDYNDPKLKEILGACHGYSLDKNVELSPFRVLQPEVNKYFPFEEDRNPVLKFDLYIWNMKSKGKDWFLIKPAITGGEYLVIDPNYCKELHYNGNIGDALNKDKNYIKHSYFGLGGDFRIIIYKNKEYAISSSSFDEDEIFGAEVEFFVKNPFEYNNLDYKSFEIIGATYAYLQFKTQK